MKPSRSNSRRKNSLLILIPLVVWSLLAFGLILPHASKLEASIPIKALAAACGVIWWVVLLWALHHLTFQIAALFMHVPSHKAQFSNPIVPIAILYTTCDDFDPCCCQSCLDQDYPHTHLFIGDDSTLDTNQGLVDEFAAQYPARVTVVRRPDRRGFKAGNVNYAMMNVIEQDWVALVDADQVLPPGYVSALVHYMPNDPCQVAFIQAGHQVASYPDDNLFQQVMASSVALYYQRNLSHRERYGFVPLLGHGALIHRLTWQNVGHFPEVVSEDFAFALRASSQQLRGTYVGHITSYEAFPHDFGGFVLRLRKYTGGAAELFRKEMLPFLLGRATNVEKWDALMQIIWYILMPLIAINSFLTAYVAHQLAQTDSLHLHPILPYLYLWILFFTFTVETSLTEGPRNAARYYFWSTAIHTAIMPLLVFQFLRHLFIKPDFEPTPKRGKLTPVYLSEGLTMVGLGLLAATLGYLWYSPFTPTLWGHAVGYLSYPLYGDLTAPTMRGHLARLIVFFPGLFMLAGIVSAWMYIFAR